MQPTIGPAVGFERTANRLILISNLLLLAFLILLAACGRLTTDDFSFLSVLHSRHNIATALSWWWFHYCGRLVSSATITLSVSAMEHDGIPQVYISITLLTWFFAVYAFMHCLLTKRLSLSWSRWTEINIFVLAAGLAIFASFDRGEVWFWLTGSATYLWPIILLMLGAALLLAESVSVKRIAVATFLFVLACGCNESAGLLPIVLLSSLLLHKLIRNRRVPAKNRLASTSKYLWPLMASVIMTAIVYTAPGNHARMQGGPPLNIAHGIILCPQVALNVIRFSFLHRFPWYVIAIGVGFVIGDRYRAEHAAWNSKQILRSVAVGSICCFGAICLSLLPATLALQAAPPFRAWFQSILLFLTLGGGVGFLFAQYAWKGNLPVAWRTGIILSLLASPCLTLYYMRQQSSIVIGYARAYDARYKDVLRRRDRNETQEIVVTALPSSPDRWINTYDITEDTHHWINQAFKGALRLHFDVRLKR